MRLGNWNLSKFGGKHCPKIITHVGVFFESSINVQWKTSVFEEN